MKRHTHKPFPPTSSSDVSDSEDPYGFEIDDIPASSDSELISHPSDNEDQSGSGAISDQDTDDDQALPTFSLISQNFDGYSVSPYLPDDFCFVETSDLDVSSRPHSSLSHHSDFDRPEDPMHFIYPSLLMAPASNETLPIGDGVQEQSVAKDLSTQNEGLPHMDQTHDIQATIDSSLETILAEQIPSPQQSSLSVDDSEPNQQIPSPNDEQILSSSEDMEVPLSGQALVNEDFENRGVTNFQDQYEARAIPTQLYTSDVEYDSLETSVAAIIQPAIPAKSTQEVVAQSHSRNELTASKSTSIGYSWSKYFLVFAFVILFGGYLATKYYHHSVRPAHVVISNISYADDANLAVVELSVFTYKLRQETRRNRPPGFHVRVLNDNNSWSLEEAPAHLLKFFGQPIVGCAWGGWCKVYIPVHQTTSRYKASEFICSNSSYFLHIWFANGTRVPSSPPEIFPNRKGGIKHECDHQDSKTETDKNADNDNYIYFWKSQLQVLAEDVKAVAHLSQPLTLWIGTQWNRLLSANGELQNMVDIAIAYCQRSTNMVKEQLQNCMTNFKVVEEPSMLRRAQNNAKKLSEQFFLKFGRVADQTHGVSSTKWSRQPSSEIGQRVVTLKMAAKDQWSKMASKNTVYKVNQLITEVEHTIESLIDPRTSEIIQRRADQLVKRAENIYNSKAMQSVNRKIQTRVDRLLTTSAGKKVVREAKLIKEDVLSLWRDLQL